MRMRTFCLAVKSLSFYLTKDKCMCMLKPSHTDEQTCVHVEESTKLDELVATMGTFEVILGSNCMISHTSCDTLTSLHPSEIM